jgi:aminopeptidase N
MALRLSLIVLFVTMITGVGSILAASSQTIVEQRISLSLDPDQHRIESVVEINLPEDPGEDGIDFLLHAGLQPEIAGSGQLTRLESHHPTGGLPIDHYRIHGSGRTVILRYAGRISHPPLAREAGRGRSEEQTVADIGPEGIYLSGAGAWYPLFPGRLIRFDLSVGLPEGWLSMSQGREIAPNHWRENSPQDEIYLVAGRYHNYRGNRVQVMLFQQDKELATRYIEAGERHLKLYEELIGPYPYAKFAVVENRWQSGYGMPSFTLLGSRVIRLPFIPETSLPHEILHNWWGNGVYVDYAGGNWSEGLTAYLADHLLREREGRDRDYRRDQLEAYAAHAHSDNLPLKLFTSRHDPASQAIGYGKSLLLFHMVRRRIGDSDFIDGLRHFYRNHQFKSASFDDLRHSFEQVSDRELGQLFGEWTSRSGAVELDLLSATAHGDAGSHQLTLRVAQRQSGPPFPLDLPVVIALEGSNERVVRRLEMNQREVEWTISLPAAPRRVAIDPDFELFRRLEPGERPPTLAALLGSPMLTLIVPAEPAEENSSYTSLARTWAAGYAGRTSIRNDQQEWPGLDNSAVLILGSNNRFRNRLLEQLQNEVTINDERVELAGDTFSLAMGSLLLTSDRIGWLSASPLAAIPGLTRKLPQ